MERDDDPAEGTSSKSGEPKRKKMKPDDSVPKEVDVPTEEKPEEEDSDESFDTPDEDEDSSTSTDGSEESPPRDISHLPIAFVINSQKVNKIIKKQLLKEIRKLGKIYDRIFDLLEDVRGPLRIKKKFVNIAIEESRKYNRDFLIKELSDYLESMCARHRKK